MVDSKYWGGSSAALSHLWRRSRSMKKKKRNHHGRKLSVVEHHLHAKMLLSINYENWECKYQPGHEINALDSLLLKIILLLMKIKGNILYHMDLYIYEYSQHFFVVIQQLFKCLDQRGKKKALPYWNAHNSHFFSHKAENQSMQGLFLQQLFYQPNFV